MTAAERQALSKHYAELKNEMSIDTKQLSARSQLKALQTNKQALERKLIKVQEVNRTLEKQLADEKYCIDKLTTDAKEIRAEMRQIDSIIEQNEDKR